MKPDENPSNEETIEKDVKIEAQQSENVNDKSNISKHNSASSGNDAGRQAHHSNGTTGEDCNATQQSNTTVNNTQRPKPPPLTVSFNFFTNISKVASS